MVEPAEMATWPKRFIQLLGEATRELRRHSDALPIPSDDRNRCRAGAEHLGALISLMEGDPVDGCLIANLPQDVRERLLNRCAGDWEIARQYLIESVSTALRWGVEPHELGIGLGDLADGLGKSQAEGEARRDG